MAVDHIPEVPLVQRRGLVAARLADRVVAGGPGRREAQRDLEAICRRSGAKAHNLLADAERRAAEHRAGG